MIRRVSVAARGFILLAVAVTGALGWIASVIALAWLLALVGGELERRGVLECQHLIKGRDHG